MLAVLSLDDGDVKCLFKIVFAHRHFLTFYSARASVTMVEGCFGKLTVEEDCLVPFLFIVDEAGCCCGARSGKMRY